MTRHPIAERRAFLLASVVGGRGGASAAPIHNQNEKLVKVNGRHEETWCGASSDVPYGHNHTKEFQGSQQTKYLLRTLSIPEMRPWIKPPDDITRP
ncbi:hypothetical protein GN956_G17149 [Arapaima gigas]